MYMQRTTSGAAGNGLYTTIMHLRGASGIGMGTTAKHLGRTTSAAAGNGLGATITPFVVQRLLKFTQSPTPGHVPWSACVWGPS